jgi:hypothetical protein
MTDIVDRLRHCSENCGDEYLHELAGRAASEIERLRAAMATIRAEVLEEAAKAAEGIKTVWIDGYAFHVDGPSKDTIAAAIRALKDKHHD